VRFNQSDDILREDVVITDRGRLRSAVLGPDGNLYIAQDSVTGGILRVTPNP
jgi:hypothetical protein